jgi:ribonuclease D
MTDTIWIDRDSQVEELAGALAGAQWIGIDTEFMRERTFYPKLCLVQISAAGGIWLIDTLKVKRFAPLLAPLAAAGASKILHAARQDLEALYLLTRQVVAPVFDTQVAAGCIGMKAQVGYADLVKALLGVSIGKSQTRTDWARRPLSTDQLAYAAEDVVHLHDIAERLRDKLEELGRTGWVAEDCALLANPQLYDPDPASAWKRLKGLAQLPPRARGIAMTLAVWRERLARDKDLPRSWILSDPGLFSLAQANPADAAHAIQAAPECGQWPPDALQDMVESVRASVPAEGEALRADDLRPTPEQKAQLNRLAAIVDARAQELSMSAEILAPRGELKALVMAEGDPASLDLPSLRGWRRQEIGEALLAAL